MRMRSLKSKRRRNVHLSEIPYRAPNRCRPALTTLFALTGCGCIEKYTDPRFNENPHSGDDAMRPRDPVDFPDHEQPAWHRCVFGTRWLMHAPGVTTYPDDNQPYWQRQLFGPRYTTRDSSGSP